MGVSLERVQFKFASIIGELCSDPDVLSQFAVWLDLRLAEYKLKGAISLDCSGEEPDPIWLKGLNKSKKDVDSAHSNPRDHRHERRLPSASPTRHRSPLHVPRHPPPQSPLTNRPTPPSPQTTTGGDRLQQHSPEVFIVKDEPSDIFPVHLHSNVGSDAQTSEAQKRTAADSFANDSDNWSQELSTLATKRRRSGSEVRSPANQSLMSVLGVTDSLQSTLGEEHSVSVKGDNSVLTSGPVAGVSSPSMAAGTSADLTGDFSADFTNSSFNNSQSLPDIGWMNQSGTSADTFTDSNNVGAYDQRLPHPGHPYHGSQSQTPPQPHLEYTSRGREYQHENQRRKSKIGAERLAGIPRQTVTSMAAAVGTFERWFWQRYENDKRAITDIPPNELNTFLAEFFSVIKTPSGADYKPESFVGLKCYLGRYLKETNYPVLFSSSPVFQTARDAFRDRKLTFRHGH